MTWQSGSLARPILIFVALQPLGGCGAPEAVPTAAQSQPPPAPHVRAEIPIDINTLTEEQSRLIRLGNESDPTPYLMQSRPVVCQIVETVNDADEVRTTGPILKRAEVLIYALGEAAGGRLVDYGWLENASTGDRVWEMTLENSEHGGGDLRNRRALETLWLEPGRYELHYVSDGAHAFGDWRGAPPERELFYGVVVFNLAGIESIEARFREAGIALDRGPR